jgi:hypothetical protein
MAAQMVPVEPRDRKPSEHRDAQAYQRRSYEHPDHPRSDWAIALAFTVAPLNQRGVAPSRPGVIRPLLLGIAFPEDHDEKPGIDGDVLSRYARSSGRSCVVLRWV